MLLTKYGHACVRLEKDDQVIVIDPGAYSEPESLRDAVAVLITHEHADHVDPELLVAAQTGNPSLVVHSNADVVAQLTQKGVTAQPVSPGNAFSVAGFDVRVVGGEHAEIYDGLPGCANVGFVVDDAVYHPGDSLFVPDGEVETLLVIQRADNGHWELPGGVLELGESFEDGVVREVLEETGITVSVERLSGVYKNLEKGIVALVYRCHPIDGDTATTDESRDTRWIDPGVLNEIMDEAYAIRLLDAFGQGPVKAVICWACGQDSGGVFAESVAL